MRAASSLAHKRTLLALALMTNLSQACTPNETRIDKKINNNLTLEQISEIVRTTLPRGTARSEIDKYFTDNHIEHGFYKNQILGMIRNIRGGIFPVQKDAQIIITLDQAEN